MFAFAFALTLCADRTMIKDRQWNRLLYRFKLKWGVLTQVCNLKLSRAVLFDGDHEAAVDVPITKRDNCRLTTNNKSWREVGDLQNNKTIYKYFDEYRLGMTCFDSSVGRAQD
jgi:hypothetical protein